MKRSAVALAVALAAFLSCLVFLVFRLHGVSLEIAGLGEEVTVLSGRLDQAEERANRAEARATTAEFESEAALALAEVAEELAEDARGEASRAQSTAALAREESVAAERARAAAAAAQLEAERRSEEAKAREEAALAEATAAYQAATAQRAEAQRARAEVEDLRRERERELTRLQEALGELAETRRTALGLVMDLGNRVEFDFDEADLRPENRELLARIAGVLMTAGDYQIQVFGHTDDIGAEGYNQELSERRARSVVDYLVASGIRSTVISATGLGNSQPVVQGTDEEARQRNRRVEIAVISYNATYLPAR